MTSTNSTNNILTYAEKISTLSNVNSQYKTQLLNLKRKLEEHHQKMLIEKAAWKLFNEFKENWFKINNLSTLEANKANINQTIKENSGNNSKLQINNVSNAQITSTLMGSHPEILSEKSKSNIYQTTDKKIQQNFEQTYKVYHCQTSPDLMQTHTIKSNESQILENTDSQTNPSPIPKSNSQIQLQTQFLIDPNTTNLTIDLKENIEKYKIHIQNLDEQRQIYERLVYLLMQYDKQKFVAYTTPKNLSKTESEIPLETIEMSNTNQNNENMMVCLNLNSSNSSMKIESVPDNNIHLDPVQIDENKMDFETKDVTLQETKSNFESQSVFNYIKTNIEKLREQCDKFRNIKQLLQQEL